MWVKISPRSTMLESTVVFPVSWCTDVPEQASNTHVPVSRHAKQVLGAEEKCMCYSSKWISKLIDTQSPLTWGKRYPFIRASLIWTIHRHLASQIVPKITDTVASLQNRSDIFVQDHIKG